MIRVGIIGGAGYTAGELLRLLVNHPEVKIEFVNSSSSAGKPLTSVHAGLEGDINLCFTDEFHPENIDVLFLCSAHGKSREFLAENKVPDTLKIIDLAQDFRDESDGFIYGLPEMQFPKINGALKIANPGCFATAIQLSLLPAAAAGVIDGEVEITALTGSTGAGVKPSATTHFSFRDNNISSYKEFSHQHLLEIGRSLKNVSPDKKDHVLNFVPLRGDFTRGIFVTAHFHCPMSNEDAIALYKKYYEDATFTHVVDYPVNLKQVVNTNKALIHVEKHGPLLHITCVIDNLLKGASGQAVQNMNIIFGLPQFMGLKLKASAF